MARNRIKLRELRAQLLDVGFERRAHNLHLQKQAQRIVTRAIQDGALKRKTRCEICHVREGSLVLRTRSSYTRVRILAHHCDYKKPLVVVFLCGVCHYAVHNPYTAFSQTLCLNSSK